jgi:phytanoyl-CoA hydroxylase
MQSLSQAQRQDYDRTGYLVIPGMLGESTLALVRRSIARQVDREAHRLREEGLIAELFEDLPFTRRLVEVYGPKKSKSIGWNQEVFSREIYELGTNETILDVAEDLVGPELQFNGDYWVRTKLPGESVTTFPWHQDSGYYGDPTDFHIPSLWIPLVDVDEHNGCMQVLPGSHKWGLRPVDSDSEGHHIPTEDIESRGEIVTLPMKAGDIFAFHNLTYHRSLMNRSDGIRWSIDLRYSEIGRPLEWLFKAGLNGFNARSRRDPDSVNSWEDWKRLRRAAGVIVED